MKTCKKNRSHLFIHQFKNNRQFNANRENQQKKTNPIIGAINNI